MNSSPAQILAQVLSPQIAEALAKTGAPLESLAKSALAAWINDHPGYSGPAPDGLPTASLTILEARMGLAKAEAAPPKLASAIELLVKMARERADRAVMGWSLEKAVGMDSAQAWAATKRAYRTKLPGDHAKAASAHRQMEESFSRAPFSSENRLSEVRHKNKAEYHEAEAKKSSTTKAEPTPKLPHDKGSPDKPDAHEKPTPPQKTPPTIKPPKQNPKAALEFSKSEVETLTCKKCLLKFFDKEDFSGCLCFAELGKSASTAWAGDVLRVELETDLADVHLLAKTLSKPIQTV